MNTLTEPAIDLLLIRLHDAARADGYPPLGLPIYGDANRREEMRQVVRQWVAEMEPEGWR